MVIAPVHGFARQVAQRIVHPTHIPLEVKPEAPCARRTRDARPSRCFFRDGERIGILPVHGVVETAEEGHRIQVLPPPVAVGQPLTVATAIVEVQHGRDAIDAQAVRVKLVEPEDSARSQEALHLEAAIVEHDAAPLGVFPLARVFMLV